MNRKFWIGALGSALAVAASLNLPTAEACPLSQPRGQQRAPAVPNPYQPVSYPVVNQTPVNRAPPVVKIVSTAPVIETKPVVAEVQTALPAFSVVDALARR